MQMPASKFQDEHISTYQKYVGEPLNILDANGNQYVPEDRKEAQAVIKDAHRLVKEWTIKVKNRLFPEAPDPDKNITATNQRGNFRDYLPQTIYPSKNSSSLLWYWFYLWRDKSTPDNKIYFRITLGLNEDKSSRELKRKLENLRIESALNSPMLDGYQGAKMSMDELTNWAVDAIKKLSLTYDEVREKLEPELTESEKIVHDEHKNSGYWIEKCGVKGRADREEGDNALGKSLWSPQKGSAGANIYQNMLMVKPGDVILHLVDNKSLVGVSIAANRANDQFMCLNGTEWSGKPGYRVQLRDYVELDPELSKDLIFKNQKILLDILEKNKGLFYNKKLELNQGKYLTKAPQSLVDLLSEIYLNKTSKQLPHMPHINHQGQKIMGIEEKVAYDIDKATEGLFITKEEFVEILDLLKFKKNLILQGPPGTGKSFIAKRLAYALIGEKDDNRIASIQFHQSFSYEDFIQGYRPKKDSSGFHLQDGVFYSFCQKAKQDSSRPYIFVIDEINRGNLSKIFGEVMLLIESDKRGEDWAVKLTYSDENDKSFYIPDNVYILGMMNTADRSLAMVDYALRRRFAFKDITPGFDNLIFEQVLSSKQVAQDIIRQIRFNIAELNKSIEKSVDLGSGFLIGHSFFVPSENIKNSKDWYNRIIKNEIAPLLKEYWFDRKKSEVEEDINLLKAK